MNRPVGFEVFGSRVARFEDRAITAMARVNAIEEAAFDILDDDAIVAEVFELYAPGLIEIDWNEMTYDLRAHTDNSDPYSDPNWDLTLTLPIQGAIDALPGGLWGGSTSTNSPGAPSSINISAVVTPTAQIAQNDLQGLLNRTRENWKNALEEAVTGANEAISEVRAKMRLDLSARVSTKGQIIRATRGAATVLGIALHGSSDAAVKIPLTPRGLTLDRLPSRTGATEYALSSEIADEVMRTIISFTRALERLRSSSNRLLETEEEETLRDFLLFVLNANWQGLATGETFINDGKCDILLRYADRDAFIAECKIWTGEKALVGAIEQLMGRYVPWRDTRVALIVFIRDRVDVTAIIAKALAAIRSCSLYVGDGTSKIDGCYDFRLMSKTDAARGVRLSFIPVPVPKMP